MQCLRQVSLCLGLCLALEPLTSCGGSSAPRDAMPGNVTVASQAQGPTLFIARVGLEVERADLVRSVAYTIAAKPGAASRPVSVAYGGGYLVRRGLLDIPGCVRC